MIPNKWKEMSRNCRHNFIYHIDAIDCRCTTGFAAKNSKDPMIKTVTLEPSFCYDVLEDEIEAGSGPVKIETRGEGLSFTSNFGQHYQEIMKTWERDIKKLDNLPVYITRSYNSYPYSVNGGIMEKMIFRNT